MWVDSVTVSHILALSGKQYFVFAYVRTLAFMCWTRTEVCFKGTHCTGGSFVAGANFFLPWILNIGYFWNTSYFVLLLLISSVCFSKSPTMILQLSISYNGPTIKFISYMIPPINYTFLVKSGCRMKSDVVTSSDVTFMVLLASSPIRADVIIGVTS